MNYTSASDPASIDTHAPLNIASRDPMPIPATLHRAQSMLDVLHKDLNELEARLEPVAPSKSTLDSPEAESVKEPGPTCEMDAKLHDIVSGITRAKRRVTDMLGRLKL